MEWYLTMNNTIKIEGSEWFTNSTGTVGAVLCWDTVTGRYKAYIGGVLGTDKGRDEQHIAEWGSKLPYRIALGFFPDIAHARYGWN